MGQFPLGVKVKMTTAVECFTAREWNMGVCWGTELLALTSAWGGGEKKPEYDTTQHSRATQPES